MLQLDIKSLEIERNGSSNYCNQIRSLTKENEILQLDIKSYEIERDGATNYNIFLFLSPLGLPVPLWFIHLFFLTIFASVFLTKVYRGCFPG